MLVCDNIVKQYTGIKAVDGINIRLEYGKIYALLGPNGSGKSTFMKMVVGLIKPTSGHIYIDDVEVCDETKAKVTYMPTENYFYPYMKIKDIVKFFKDFYADFDEKIFDELVRTMELDMFKDKVKNMSTGMLAKLKVAAAMARRSPIILLDEPLNGIDIIAREHVMNAILKYITPTQMIIVSSHLVDELDQVCGGAIFVRRGQIALAGDIAEIKQKNNDKSLVDLYKEIYGGGLYA